MRPALDGHGLVEDYYVVQVSRFEPETDAPALLGTHRDLLARIVHCEPQPLSPSETDEVLRTAVTYRPRDLVVTDWNVALVYDEEYEDALDVLELLNVQLLELRFLDTMLDRRIAPSTSTSAARAGCCRFAARWCGSASSPSCASTPRPCASAW